MTLLPSDQYILFITGVTLRSNSSDPSRAIYFAFRLHRLSKPRLETFNKAIFGKMRSAHLPSQKALLKQLDNVAESKSQNHQSPNSDIDGCHVEDA